jgi:hypothetical protein
MEICNQLKSEKQLGAYIILDMKNQDWELDVHPAQMIMRVFEIRSGHGI